MANLVEMVNKGSTRVVWVGNLGELIMVMSRNLSALDVGTCSHRFPGIDMARIDFAEKFFAMLDEHNITHNFVYRIDRRTVAVREFRRYKLQSGIYSLMSALSGVDNGRLLPLECLVRLEVAKRGFLDRLEDSDDPLTPERLGVSSSDELSVGSRLDPIYVEFSTKLEQPKDRYIDDDEAMKISGVTSEQLDNIKTIARRIAVLLSRQASKNGFNLKDLKLEFAIGCNGDVIVADLMSPDETRMVDEDGFSYDKDIFRDWLESVGFTALVKQAREEAKVNGHDPIYPEYPHVTSATSKAVSNGYRAVVDAFWA